MTLKIESPHLESRIRELAAAHQMDAEAYLAQLLSTQAPEPTQPSPHELSVEEFNAILDRIADRIPKGAPLLSDEALSRENLYDERCD